jgi:hypothetical protein
MTSTPACWASLPIRETAKYVYVLPYSIQKSTGCMDAFLWGLTFELTGPRRRAP